MAAIATSMLNYPRARDMGTYFIVCPVKKMYSHAYDNNSKMIGQNLLLFNRTKLSRSLYPDRIKMT